MIWKCFRDAQMELFAQSMQRDFALTKQQDSDMKKFWDKAFDKDTDFVQSTKALREKLQKAEKDKTKEQK